MQDRALPDEVLQVIFTIAMEDDASTSVVLPLINKYFLLLANNTCKTLLGKYLGPSLDLSCFAFHSYPTFFYKIIQEENKRLKRCSQIVGIILKGMKVTNDSVSLPTDLEFFIISAVSARAYEELHALIEQIHFMHTENISIKRVIDAIYVQALLNYNEVELLRLISFIPININDLIGDTQVSDHHREYICQPLINHAVRFGNKKIVINLIRLGAEIDITLLEDLKNKLIKSPNHYRWKEIYHYLAERISPQTAPPDCPGPL